MARKKFWTSKRDKILRERFADCDMAELGAEIGVSADAVKSRAQKLGLRRNTTRREWTDEQNAYLTEHYATTPTEECAEKTGHPASSIYKQAKKLGLTKCPEFVIKILREKSGHPNSVAHQFKKGIVPANKGKRQYEFMSSEGIENSLATRFKEGHVPHNLKPVGYERVCKKDGYVYVKVKMGCKMVLKHRWVWEQAHGEIPEGYNVAFRDGNRENCSLENLYLISRSDAARKQVWSESAEARSARVAKAQKKRNEGIRRDKVRIHWGFEPKGRLVKRW